MIGSVIGSVAINVKSFVSFRFLGFFCEDILRLETCLVLFVKEIFLKFG